MLTNCIKYIVEDLTRKRRWQVQADCPDMAIVAVYFATKKREPLFIVNEKSEFTAIEKEDTLTAFHDYVCKRIKDDKDLILDIINTVKPYEK